MFPRTPGDREREGSPYRTPNGNLSNDKKKKHSTPYSPVVVVLQHCTPPHFTTPLRCKDFYSSLNAACRICHEDGSPDSLISPCNCTGSLGRMHKKCLEKWLSTSNTDRCEICKYRFHVAYRTRPIWQWIFSDGPMGPKCFIGDMICLLILLPLSVMSVYLCGFGAHNYLKTHEWQATGLALLCLFLLLAFLLWSALTFRFHYLRFRDWQRSNLIVKLLIHPQEEQASVGSNINDERRHNNSSNEVPPERYTPNQEFVQDFFPHSNSLSLNLSGVETRL